MTTRYRRAAAVAIIPVSDSTAARKVRELLNASPPADPIGYHGTSLWAVVRAAETGALPLRHRHDPVFCYVPASAPGAREEAHAYARSNASVHFTMEFLALSTIDEVYRAIAAGNPDVASVSEDVSDEGLLLGVLLSLGQAVSRFASSDSPQGEVWVRTPPEGLPLECVSRITPVGLRDREILADFGLA